MTQSGHTREEIADALGLGLQPWIALAENAAMRGESSRHLAVTSCHDRAIKLRLGGVNFYPASKINFQVPTEPETLQPSYFVFFWGEIEKVPDGEDQRMRVALKADTSLRLDEIVSWARKESKGRVYAVLLGSPEKTEAGHPYIKLFLLDGEYPAESDYDDDSLMDGSFSSPSI